MTATVNDVLDAVATTLHAALDLKNVEPYPPDRIVPPCGYVVARGGTVETMHAGYVSIEFEAYVLTSGALDRAGYGAAMRYVNASGDLSVIGAISAANDPRAGSFAGLVGVRAATTSWRFLDRDEVDRLEGFGVVFPGTAYIKET